MIKDGKKYANAETIINYKDKSIKFNYNNKQYDNNKKWERFAFFGHAYYHFMSYPLIITFFIAFVNIFEAYTTINPNNTMGSITLFYSGMFLVFLAPIILMGYLSILIHTLSETARKNFPTSNAFMKNGHRWKKIDLSKQKDLYYEGYKHNNIFLHWKYSISKFEYNYIGENKLLTVKTKSIEKELHKGEHFKYVCMFEFEKPIKDGIIMWR